MNVTHKSRLQQRISSGLFVILLLIAAGLTAWLSTRYSMQFDWTAGARNTLSETSRALLTALPEPVHITAYAREERTLRKQIQNLVGRYQRYDERVTLAFVNPDTVPDQVRDLGIDKDGTLVVEYQDRHELVTAHSEQTLSNAIQRVARNSDRWVIFVGGHGERAGAGEANHDLGAFGKELEARGFKLGNINLGVNNSVPEQTGVLVVASPRVNYLPGEVEVIKRYLDGGGNLLWLSDPGDPHGLQPLADYLGVVFLDGTVVDTAGQILGLQDPANVLVSDYPVHAITEGFHLLTLFPHVSAMVMQDDELWQRSVLLHSLPRSWTEIGPIEGEISFDPDAGEHRGPLALGMLLTRDLAAISLLPPAASAADEAATSDTPPPAREQRALVMGDGDFLSNSFLANGGNLDLGLKMIYWLTEDEQFLKVPAKTAPDVTLNLSPTATAIIGFGALFGIPALLLAAGIGIWLRRRRR